MKVQVFFEMPLPAESEPYLELIAKAHGFVPGGDTSRNDFIRREVCEKQVSELFRTLIVNALSAQLGLSGSDQIATIEATYRADHKVSADFVEN